jgi:hypothetical protein
MLFVFAFVFVFAFDDGEHAFIVRQSDVVTSAELNWCTACYAIRPSSVYMIHIFAALKKTERTIISLYDDDLLNLPKGSTIRWRAKYVRACIENSDIIVSPNPLIIKDFKKLFPSPKYVLINTHIKDEDIKTIPLISNTIRIIYAAGRDHTLLFDEFVKPSLNDLYNRYGDRIDLTLIGVNPSLAGISNSNWIHLVKTLPYEQYKKYMRENDFDIGLAPLIDDSFSNRKYFNKYFEYSKNGIAGLYSNCLPYTLIIENGKNGFLVENTVESWYDSICKSIESISLIKEIAKESQNELKKYFSLSSIREVIHKEIDSFIRTTDKVSFVSYKYSFFSKISYELLSRWNIFVSHVYRDGFLTTVWHIFGRQFN